MTFPPLLLGLALLFWGWQSGLFGPAALIAVVLEGARVFKTRWVLTPDAFRRLWHLSTILLLAAVLYALSANEGEVAWRDFLQPSSRPGAMRGVTRTTLQFFQWLPLVFALQMVAHAYSRQTTVNLSTVPFFRRWWQTDARQLDAALDASFNVVWPYWAMCLLAASVAPRHGTWFFGCLTVLLAWALWVHRSPRYALLVWAASFATAIGLGYVALQTFHYVSQWAWNYNPGWLLGGSQVASDANAVRTSIGRIGRLKLSGRIVMRVQPRDGDPVPSLLREASYQVFKSPVWHSGGTNNGFEITSSEPNETEWRLLPNKPTSAAVTIARQLPQGRGLLALPLGTAKLDRLHAFILETNALGNVSVDSGAGFVEFDAWHGPGPTLDSPPGPEDLHVPEDEEAALTRVQTELGLVGMTPSRIVQRVGAFFLDDFRYSTWQTPLRASSTNASPLSTFLLDRRSGHCEFFASATTLLLRKAGVPARYVVGYAVEEKAGEQYVVRHRHAHAWCLAFLDGAWRNVDNTPGSWLEVERQRASFLEPLSDAWQRLWFEFARWRWGQTQWRRYIPWIIAPALIILTVQLLWRSRWRRLLGDGAALVNPARFPGMDSEFYLFERELTAAGHPRGPSETCRHWLNRLAEIPALRKVHPSLREALILHYRFRFDPAGLAAADREALRSNIQSGLNALRTISTHASSKLPPMAGL